MFVKALTLTRQYIVTHHTGYIAIVAPIGVSELTPFVFLFFLRLSNILPHTVKGFDIFRQLCRGDLIFSQDSVVIIIKWSKTLQDRRNVATFTHSRS